MKRNCYLLFSDIKDFSKMSENEFEIFSNEFIPYVYENLKDQINSALSWNTWGDAIFISADDPNMIVKFSIAYRELFTSFNFESKIGKRLLPRIACHFGEVTLIDDPTIGKKNLFGTHVNTAARLEPSTRPGEIFVTRSFVENYNSSASSDKNFKFDPVGRIVCAKAFGELDAFRMRRSCDPEQVIDWLSTLDLTNTLPEPPSMAEKASCIRGLQSLTPPAAKVALDAIASQPDYIGDTLLVIADLYKKFGFYEDSLHTLSTLENFELSVDGMKIHPYRSRIDAQKIKANALTRLGRYEEAANIVYSLWSSGHKDSDTLSMLAAQYKRRAIYGDRPNDISSIDVNNIDLDLIDRAKKLYLEAFRMNLDDFYPAINAAYLFKMFSTFETGAGSTKLALYIKEAWKSFSGKNWWTDITLAEAEILLDDYAMGYDAAQSAIAIHQPDNFELMSTKEQIEIYAHMTNKQGILRSIIQLLDNAITLEA